MLLKLFATVTILLFKTIPGSRITELQMLKYKIGHFYI